MQETAEDLAGCFVDLYRFLRCQLELLDATNAFCSQMRPLVVHHHHHPSTSSSSTDEDAPTSSTQVWNLYADETKTGVSNDDSHSYTTIRRQSRKQ
jgi:hypothetical protein